MMPKLDHSALDNHTFCMTLNDKLPQIIWICGIAKEGMCGYLKGRGVRGRTGGMELVCPVKIPKMSERNRGWVNTRIN